MSVDAKTIPADIVWHDETMHQLQQEVAAYRDILSTELLRDVQPADIVIGGAAVREALEHTDSYWLVGPGPEASVAVEAWTMNGNEAVRIKRGIAGTDVAQNSATLANQVKDRRGWPGARSRRTAKVADVATASTLLVVSFFEVDGDPDDEGFKNMRSAAGSGKKDEDGYKDTVTIKDSEPLPLDKTDIFNTAVSLTIAGLGKSLMEHYVGSGRIEIAPADAAYCPNDITEASQHYIDAQLRKLDKTVTLLSEAVHIMQDGARIRPSRPQHRVPGYPRTR